MIKGDFERAFQELFQPDDLHQSISWLGDMLKDEKLIAHEDVKAALIRTFVELCAVERMRFTIMRQTPFSTEDAHG